ncbi:hypothetical protein BJ878DRAFT_478320 [Calycina marina]|uniref:Macro domain-containing protein n=1 Tax=Calycina marina TaxID=1763456 RepID=A0A9P7Z799_9HELO|nr:hypothetical protein BJ878DRAFT_478320 [Calycina marina]
MAQEESICLRSTLHASFKETYYRIPEPSAVYSPDILVFRVSSTDELPKNEHFFVDVISVAAILGPNVVVAREKGCGKLVLGALGCGVFRNPPEEVARIFKKVIFGGRKRAGVKGVEEVVFAIFDEGENLDAFREVFEDIMETEDGSGEKHVS